MQPLGFICEIWEMALFLSTMLLGRDCVGHSNECPGHRNKTRVSSTAENGPSSSELDWGEPTHKAYCWPTHYPTTEEINK